MVPKTDRNLPLSRAWTVSVISKLFIEYSESIYLPKTRWKATTMVLTPPRHKKTSSACTNFWDSNLQNQWTNVLSHERRRSQDGTLDTRQSATYAWMLHHVNMLTNYKKPYLALSTVSQLKNKLRVRRSDGFHIINLRWSGWNRSINHSISETNFSKLLLLSETLTKYSGSNIHLSKIVANDQMVNPFGTKESEFKAADFREKFKLMKYLTHLLIAQCLLKKKNAMF